MDKAPPADQVDRKISRNSVRMRAAIYSCIRIDIEFPLGKEIVLGAGQPSVRTIEIDAVKLALRKAQEA
jgi:hypothetical protein